MIKDLTFGLAELDPCGEDPPVLAELTPDGTLTLNMGPRVAAAKDR